MSKATSYKPQWGPFGATSYKLIMFEQLFGSKTRAKLIKTFLEYPDRAFYVRELTRISGSMINSVRRELKILEDLDIIYVEKSLIEKNIVQHNLPSGLNTKKFYKLNQKNVFHKELRNIFKKNDIINEKNLANDLGDISGVYLAVLVGVFIKNESSPTDVLIVAEPGQNKRILPIVKTLQNDIKKEMSYTILTSDEFLLRKDINDRFLYAILNDRKKITLVDKLKEINK